MRVGVADGFEESALFGLAGDNYFQKPSAGVERQATDWGFGFGVMTGVTFLRKNRADFLFEEFGIGGLGVAGDADGKEEGRCSTGILACVPYHS